VAEIVADCPRCGANKTTFDVKHTHVVGFNHGWQQKLELQSICRNCQRGVILTGEQADANQAFHQLISDGLEKLKGNVNELVRVTGYISLKDANTVTPPDHLPTEIEASFREGALCAAIGCHNASAAMFRLCVDHATWDLLPEDGVDGLNAKIRRSLGLRMKWLFDTGRLPAALQDLSDAIKEDGNDGAHEGTLTKAESEDLEDFTIALLERLYTEPTRIQIAKERREARRAASPG
jgi:hypothetical protein